MFHLLFIAVIAIVAVVLYYHNRKHIAAIEASLKADIAALEAKLKAHVTATNAQSANKTPLI